MQPDSNQPATLYGTAKTHKFQSLEDITAVNLKFRPIIAQTGTSRYKLCRIISDLYVKINIPSIIHKNLQAFYLQLKL